MHNDNAYAYGLFPILADAKLVSYRLRMLLPSDAEYLYHYVAVDNAGTAVDRYHVLLLLVLLRRRRWPLLHCYYRATYSYNNDKSYDHCLRLL